MGAESERGGSTDLALVLSGGGARSAYQVGVLSAIAEYVPALRIPVLTGVSAGAINTVFLAAHRGPFGEAVASMRREWARLTLDQVFSTKETSALSSLARWGAQAVLARRLGAPDLQGLLDVRPLRKFLAEAIDFSGIETNLITGRLRAVALSATSYATGCTVTFVHSGAEVPMWERAGRMGVRERIGLDHLMASSALPILFPAVPVDGCFYGDGSVRQTAPLSPAIHLGARRLLVIAMRDQRPSPRPAVLERRYPAPAEIMALLFHAVFLDALDMDIEHLERTNRLLAALRPGESPPDGLHAVNLLQLRPSRDVGALARGHSRRLSGSLRWLFRGISGQREKAADFLSYLLFDPGYTSILAELGYEDARREWPAIERLLAGG